MLTKSEYIIYGLVDPESKLIRYIGKSTIGHRRPRQHRTPSALRGGTRRDNWIKSLLTKGLCYAITTLEISNRERLSSDECWWIAYGLALGWPLTNLTKGGDGTVGYKHKPETRQKLSELAKGRTVSETTKEAVRQASIGRVKSEEELNKMRKAATGRVKSEEELEKMRQASKAQMTPERRKQIGEQHRGLKHTEETKQKISEANRGRIVKQHVKELSRQRFIEMWEDEEFRKKEIERANNRPRNARGHFIRNKPSTP